MLQLWGNAYSALWRANMYESLGIKRALHRGEVVGFHRGMTWFRAEVIDEIVPSQASIITVKIHSVFLCNVDHNVVEGEEASVNRSFLFELEK